MLTESGISFRLVYGQEYPGAVPKTVKADLPWAIFAPNLYLHLAGHELVWQKVPLWVLNADLLIVEQANRLLINYLLFLFRKIGCRLAFEGHGRNMQSIGVTLKENIKRHLTDKVDWWFAYTEHSRQEVMRTKFPGDRITTFNNSIDTSTLSGNLGSVSNVQVDELLTQFGITSQRFVCLYCGGLYPDKKLDFLLAACGRIHAVLPEFSLIVVGGGPETYKIQNAAARYGWLHFAGPKFGTDLAPYFRCARALLMPGLVGLVVIDSFVAGVPLITTDNKIHSPEIAYLRHGENGLITPYDEIAYANAVIAYLECPAEHLRSGCLQSASEFTLENMAFSFANGIKQCLAMGRR